MKKFKLFETLIRFQILFSIGSSRQDAACLPIEDLQTSPLSDMNVTTKSLVWQPKPISVPKSQILIDGSCQEVLETVLLNGVKSPVLQIEGNQILLERPVQRLFDGQWTAEYILSLKGTGEDVYRQRFRVQITSLINAVPRFKDLERGQYHLTSWEVHTQITDEYQRI